MKTLFKNANIIDVFSKEIFPGDLLMEDGIILGTGDYAGAEADVTEDVGGRILCPGLIDGHMHIESTMLTPAEFCRAALPHGTTAVMADPHEIANVCGEEGIRYMIEASRSLPMDIFFNLPSCVPATPFDESKTVLTAEKLEPLYGEERVVGLGEMMNYPGVLAGDEATLEKIRRATALKKPVDGHAPLLTGRDLDRYILSGVQTDHECSSYEEAKERIRKGQWVMIRQGTAARNLQALLPLLDEPASGRCLLVTDDREPSDLAREGHIDNILRLIAASGRDILAGIQAATANAAACFGLRNRGALAPGYCADVLVLDDLDTFRIRDVYKDGRLVVKEGKVLPFPKPSVNAALMSEVTDTVHCGKTRPEDFFVKPEGKTVRCISLVPGELLTEETLIQPDFNENNGIDPERDVLKMAVIERHRNTGHIGISYVSGIGLKEGAIASTVSHDSHNVIVIGTNHGDMALAANRIREIGGGNVVVRGGEVLSELRLPVAGLMSDAPASEVAAACAVCRETVHTLGVPEGIAPFMNMAFLSLPVIPHIKLTSMGLVDVDGFRLVPLFPGD